MPNMANQQFFESVVPRDPRNKVWYAKLACALDIPFDLIKYYHSDKRSKCLSSSRLVVISDQISKVHSDINVQHQCRGAELHDIIGEFKQRKSGEISTR